MKLNNPWIDPRVCILEPRAAEVYLLARGWKSLGPALNPVLVRFESPEGRDGARNVLMPLEIDEGAFLQRMIDLVGEVALFEGRWAPDVITDMLAALPHDDESTCTPSPASVR